MRAPEFWRRRGPASLLLAPIGALYGLGGRLRETLVRPEKVSVPVICVGNLVAGGAGKTPVALGIGAWLRGNDRKPHFLTRGHGGRAKGPLRVDPRRHDAREVGDEALLLAELAPTWVARDRRAGARAAVAAGAGVIVMDDGFQNPSLVKDLSLIVVDAEYGFGNRRLIPAGPLREPVGRGLARAQAIVLLDGGDAPADATGGGLPVLAARLVPEDDDRRFAGRSVYAFAGIGRPEKFFATLAEMGCRIVAAHAFADHHRYTPDEIMRIVEAAHDAGAVPVTTAKDFARLSPEARPMVEVVRVRIQWRDPARLEKLLAGALHS